MATNVIYAAWSAPTDTAPNNNTATPINVGTSTASNQLIKGGISPDSLVVGGTEVVGNQIWTPWFCSSTGTDCFSAADIKGLSNATGTSANVRGVTSATGFVQAGFAANTGSLNQYVAFPVAYAAGKVPVVVLNRNYTPGSGDNDNYACNETNVGFYICGDSREWQGNSGEPAPDNLYGHRWMAIGIR